jgi:hypothetical protein
MGEVHQLITEQGKLAALAGEHDRSVIEAAANRERTAMAEQLAAVRADLDRERGRSDRAEAATEAERGAREKAEAETAQLRQAEQERRRLGIVARFKAVFRP